MQNIINSDQVTTEIETLIAERENWEKKHYLPSTHILYSLLGKCLALHVQIKGDRKLIKAVNQTLDTHNIVYNSKTTLYTKVARVVFGDCGNRVFAYANVLKAAAKQNIDSTVLPDWIEAQGGIENIRSAKCNVPAQTASQRAESGADLCSTIDALFQFKQPIAELEPNPEATNEYSVALIRPSSSGTCEIVFGTNKKSIVNQVLSEVDRKLSPDASAKEAVNQNTLTHQAVDSAIQSAKASN